jgi:Domain of unknown function (DUF5710)
MINTTLRVPRAEVETVKRIGARWNATESNWCVPEGRDTAPFAFWLPPEIPADGPRIPVDILFLSSDCYRCGSGVVLVAGVWFEHNILDGSTYGMQEESRGWFLPYDETSADVIATACSDELVAAHGAGPLRWRTTRLSPDGYLANTCQVCATVLGNWPLHEAMVEYQAEGGDLRCLPLVRSALAEAALELL